MYEHSAHVYDALARHLDYEAASRRLRQLLERLAPDARTLLDVGCGTGRHLELLRAHYEVEGLDVSPQMLEIARERCPDVPLHEADLVDFALAGEFDVICCLFGSIGHARTVESLERSLRCMADHLRAGGVVAIEPWMTPERFHVGKLVFDSVDDPDLRVARMYVTRREDRMSIYEMEYLIGTPDGVDHFSERQELGLFTDGEYREAFRKAGLEMVDVDAKLFGYGFYAARLEPSRDAPDR